MTNFLLTKRCNRSCPYCFAASEMDDSPETLMSLREVVALTDQVIASNYGRVGLLGGEPTLHPQFFEILCYILHRGVRVRVFTNGLCREGLLEDLDSLIENEPLTFVVNVNDPDSEPAESAARQLAFLRRFAARCDIGVNIHSPEMDLGFVADVAERAGLRKMGIRLGIAQPIPGVTNQFLALHAYRTVTRGIVDLAERVHRRELKVSFDCGFPLCVFEDEQLGKLVRYDAHLQFRCRTAMDFGPGYEAWSCFPLTNLTKREHDGMTSLQEIAETFLEANREVREQSANHGIFEECRDCVYLRSGKCDGGCLAHFVAADAARDPDAGDP